MNSLTPQEVLDRYRQAQSRRRQWESHWRECYDFVLPHRNVSTSGGLPGEKRMQRVFDGTAPDAVDQLAASLMSHLTPPNGRWFDLVPGSDIDDLDEKSVSAELEHSTSILLSHFESSNFAVEVHQCYLDLITVGTACLMFEEAQPGEPSAFRFTAVPVFQIALEESVSGQLDTTFRKSEVSLSQLLARYPALNSNSTILDRFRKDSFSSISILEAVMPQGMQYQYLSLLEDEANDENLGTILSQGSFATSPFINFRWLKAPGEIYGRSPVMKALPDIKTANKVVELILKNASIAVTGIWQADDDGILNPATIKLVPGTIIPKAVGSAGLTPLATPGRFDVSELVLDQLRERIRKAMFVDQLGQVNGPRMTATEVLERAAAMSRVLGATFGRLQTEFLAPLIVRAISLLARRGEISSLPLDGRISRLEFRTPYARLRAQQDAQNTMLWLSVVRELGPEASAVVNVAATARWLAEAFGVPGELLHTDPILASIDSAPSEADLTPLSSMLALDANPLSVGE